VLLLMVFAARNSTATDVCCERSGRNADPKEFVDASNRMNVGINDDCNMFGFWFLIVFSHKDKNIFVCKEERER